MPNGQTKKSLQQEMANVLKQIIVVSQELHGRILGDESDHTKHELQELKQRLEELKKQDEVCDIKNEIVALTSWLKNNPGLFGLKKIQDSLKKLHQKLNTLPSEINGQHSENQNSLCSKL